MREEGFEDGADAPGARGADFSAMVKVRQDDRGWLWEYVRNPNRLSDGGGFGSAPTREEAVDRALLVGLRYLLAAGVAFRVSSGGLAWPPSAPLRSFVASRARQPRMMVKPFGASSDRPSGGSAIHRLPRSWRCLRSGKEKSRNSAASSKGQS